MSYEFCPSCGSLKERGKICKTCTTLVKSPERSQHIEKEQQFRKNLNAKKTILKAQSKPKKIVKPKHFVRYSEGGGIEYYYEIDPEVKRTRLNFCVKCKKNKLCYAGNWVRAGGKYAPEDTKKRIFICSDCWNPHKKEKD